MPEPETPTSTPTPPRAPMLPALHRVVDRREVLPDTIRIGLAPTGTALPPGQPGQFHMLWSFGIGEIPISISGLEGDVTEYTIRAVGEVTTALANSQVGDIVGVRGPFGVPFDLEPAVGRDLLVVAGGLGLAPLRPVVLQALEQRERFERLTVVIGSRTPSTLLYAVELLGWSSGGAEVTVTVDAADANWWGEVGVVTRPLGRLPLQPGRTVALVCGPEVMMRFVAGELLERGVHPDDVYVSLERNMRCATGLCGHCQLGPFFVCKDGAVFPWSRVGDDLLVRER